MAFANEPPRKSLKHCLRSFSPAWFTINMGTGAVSTLAARFFFGRGGVVLEVILTTFFLLNLFLYVLFILASITRFCMFPSLFKKMIFNPGESLFLGAFPVASATLIDAALVLNQTYRFAGRGFMYSLWGLWWFVLLASYTTAFGMIYVMMYNRHQMIGETTSLWVLPIIPLVVASAIGGSFSRALILHSKTLATLTMTFSLVSLSIGMSLTLMVITLFLIRLFLRGPPKAQLVISGFIIAGPLGMGGYSLLLHGQTLFDIFPTHLGGTVPRVEVAGQILYVVCVCGSFIFWSMATCWTLVSVFTVIVVIRNEPIPFTLTYWGAVFPNGVYALCTVQLGIALNSPFYNYLGVVWSGIVLLLWTISFIPTLLHTWDTSIFPESTPDTIALDLESVRTRSDHAVEAIV